MTTIAYRDGVIAYDSRVTEDDLIISDSYSKCFKHDDLYLFFAGDVIIVPLVADFLNGRCPDPVVGELDAIVWTGEELIWAGLSDGYYFKMPMDYGTPFALGSGKNHVYTAFDMGADALTAVKMAVKRDKNTGGNINQFCIR